MSATESYDRFDELDAGRALGDLSVEEVIEWKDLASKRKDEKSIAFDWITTELELKNSEPCPLSSSLVTRLNDTIPAFTNSDSKQVSPANLISIIPWLGWAAAACLLIFFNQLF